MYVKAGSEGTRLKCSMFAHSRINQRKDLNYNRSTKIIKVSGSSKGEVSGDGYSADRVGLSKL